MKRETLKDQINKDGSHTQIEKITQTPEDGFVPNKEHRTDWEYPGHDIGMFERGRFKGHKTTVIYQRTHTKTTRILFYVLYIIVSLIFSAIFMALISAQDTPEEANSFKMYFVGVIAFLIYGLVQSIISFRKQDQQREKERAKEQQEKD